MFRELDELEVSDILNTVYHKLSQLDRTKEYENYRSNVTGATNYDDVAESELSGLLKAFERVVDECIAGLKIVRFMLGEDQDTRHVEKILEWCPQHGVELVNELDRASASALSDLRETKDLLDEESLEADFPDASEELQTVERIVDELVDASLPEDIVVDVPSSVLEAAEEALGDKLDASRQEALADRFHRLERVFEEAVEEQNSSQGVARAVNNDVEGLVKALSDKVVQVDAKELKNPDGRQGRGLLRYWFTVNPGEDSFELRGVGDPH